MENPFSITFGYEPLNYIARVKETNDIIQTFNNENPSNFTYMFLGVRGSGKTVLLSSLSNYFEKQDNRIVVKVGAKINIIENIASDIYQKSKLKFKFLEKEFSFSFNGITFSLKGNKEILTSFSLLKEMLDILNKRNKRVLIAIDEVDNSDEMKYFLQYYSTLLIEKYKVMLLMTGLYENVFKLQEDKSLTFLYRAPKIYLSSLSISSVALNYSELLSIGDEEALKLAKLTKGYAYAYQVLGFLLFENHEKTLTKKILAEFDQYMSDYVYDKIFSSLGLIEQNIILSFKSNLKVKVNEIEKLTSIEHNKFSVYRDRLIKKGIIFSPARGYLEFTLPRFKEFLLSKESVY